MQIFSWALTITPLWNRFVKVHIEVLLCKAHLARLMSKKFRKRTQDHLVLIYICHSQISYSDLSFSRNCGYSVRRISCPNSVNSVKSHLLASCLNSITLRLRTLSFVLINTKYACVFPLCPFAVNLSGGRLKLY